MSTGEHQPKRLVILHGEIKSPPMSDPVRRRVGLLLRNIQDGEMLSLPISRPMPSIGPNVHELRLSDQRGEWRVIYQIRGTVVYVGEVFRKTREETPRQVIESCRKRFADLPE